MPRGYSLGMRTPPPRELLLGDVKNFFTILRRGGWRDFRDDLLFRWRGAPDGLPLPPLDLIVLVSNRPTSRLFYEIGESTTRRMFEILRAAGADPARFGAVLDWGCGCGRMLRHVRRATPAELHATDLNPAPIRWLRRRMPIARFARNGPMPPLAYPDARFDLVYAYSVFTHLSAESQRRWLTEIARVLRPGGAFYFTANGESKFGLAVPAARSALASEGCAVHRGAAEGRNPWATFQTREFTERLMPRELALVRHDPGRSESEQDSYVAVRT